MAFPRDSEQIVAVNRHNPLMDNILVDNNIAKPLLEALDTSIPELRMVAGAHNFITAHTGEGPAITFFLPHRYMMNGADSVTLARHLSDGTFTILFYRGSKMVDSIRHCRRDDLLKAWDEHTACAIQLPILIRDFHPGRIVATQGARAEFSSFEIRQAINRHLGCDWGDTCDSDRKLNREALKDGNRIMSSFSFNGRKLWVITEAVGENGKREATTVLLPEEY